MLLEEKPQAVIAGEVFSLRIRLLNRGNTKTNLKLELKGSLDYPVKVERRLLILEGGKSQVVKIEVKSDEKAGS